MRSPVTPWRTRLARGLLLAACAAVWCVIPFASAAEFAGTVVAVPSGQAITVERDGARVTVQLNGVECPDKMQGKARRYLSRLLLGKRVTVVALEHDSEGRMVADVFLPDGDMLNGELIRRGLAWTDGMSYAVFSDLEDEARAAKRGMWSDGTRGLPATKAPPKPKSSRP